MFRENQKARAARQAFTLVELLVSVAIIGILSGLLLPAIQQAREAARKATCQSHFRQLGLAIQNYHQAIGSFPPGCLEWRPPGASPKLKHYAWSAMLLPYLEQANLSHNIDFNLPFDHADNLAISKTDLAVYRCPSSSYREPGNSGRSDYGGIFGQRITTRKNTDNGVFVYEQPIRMIDILDGLTNTIAVGEDSLGPAARWINGDNVFEQSGSVNNRSAATIDNELRSDHIDGVMVVFTCSRYQFLSNSTDQLVLASLITRAGGEVIEESE